MERNKFCGKSIQKVSEPLQAIPDKLYAKALRNAYSVWLEAYSFLLTQMQKKSQTLPTKQADNLHSYHYCTTTFYYTSFAI